MRQLIKTPLRLMVSAESQEPFDLDDSICRGCERFSRPIDFLVRHHSEKITIYVVHGDEKRKVSGSPQSMEWFVEQQSLNARFERRDHAVDSVSCRY